MCTPAGRGHPPGAPWISFPATDTARGLQRTAVQLQTSAPALLPAGARPGGCLPRVCSPCGHQRAPAANLSHLYCRDLAGRMPPSRLFSMRPAEGAGDPVSSQPSAQHCQEAPSWLRGGQSPSCTPTPTPQPPVVLSDLASHPTPLPLPRRENRGWRV